MRKHSRKHKGPFEGDRRIIVTGTTRTGVGEQAQMLKAFADSARKSTRRCRDVMANTEEDTGTLSASSSSEGDSPRCAEDFQEIVIRNFAFEPKLAKIPVGGRVRWWNYGKQQEQLRWSNPQKPNTTWTSELLNPAESYTKRFDESGSFHFHSVMFPWVKGTLLVLNDLGIKVNLDQPLTVTEHYMRNTEFKRVLGQSSPAVSLTSNASSDSFEANSFGEEVDDRSFSSTRSVDDFAGDDSYEASLDGSIAAADDNGLGDASLDYASDSSGSFEEHDEAMLTSGGIVLIPISRKTFHEPIESVGAQVFIHLNSVKLSPFKVTVVRGSTVEWRYSSIDGHLGSSSSEHEGNWENKFHFRKGTKIGKGSIECVPVFRSPRLYSNQSDTACLQLKFSQPGHFFYQCENYPFLKGEVTVLKATDSTITTHHSSTFATLGRLNVNREDGILSSNTRIGCPFQPNSLKLQGSFPLASQQQSPPGSTSDENNYLSLDPSSNPRNDIGPSETEIRIQTNGRLSSVKVSAKLKKKKKKKKKKKACDAAVCTDGMGLEMAKPDRSESTQSLREVTLGEQASLLPDKVKKIRLEEEGQAAKKNTTKEKSKSTFLGEHAATIEDTRNLRSGEIAVIDKLPIEELLLAEEAKAAAEAIKKAKKKQKKQKKKKGSVCSNDVLDKLVLIEAAVDEKEKVSIPKESVGVPVKLNSTIPNSTVSNSLVCNDEKKETSNVSRSSQETTIALNYSQGAQLGLRISSERTKAGAVVTQHVETPELQMSSTKKKRRKKKKEQKRPNDTCSEHKNLTDSTTKCPEVAGLGNQPPGPIAAKISDKSKEEELMPSNNINYGRGKGADENSCCQEPGVVHEAKKKALKTVKANAKAASPIVEKIWFREGKTKVRLNRERKYKFGDVDDSTRDEKFCLQKGKSNVRGKRERKFKFGCVDDGDDDKPNIEDVDVKVHPADEVECLESKSVPQVADGVSHPLEDASWADMAATSDDESEDYCKEADHHFSKIYPANSARPHSLPKKPAHAAAVGVSSGKAFEHGAPQSAVNRTGVVSMISNPKLSDTAGTPTFVEPIPIGRVFDVAEARAFLKSRLTEKEWEIRKKWQKTRARRKKKQQAKVKKKVGNVDAQVGDVNEFDFLAALIPQLKKRRQQVI